MSFNSARRKAKSAQVSLQKNILRRYAGALLEDGKMKTAIEEGLASAAFVELVTALCSELKRLNQMQETVTKPAGLGSFAFCGTPATTLRVLSVFFLGAADAESFEVEMRGFLQELCCPNTQLTTSLSSYSSRLQLVGGSAGWSSGAVDGHSWSCTPPLEPCYFCAASAN